MTIKTRTFNLSMLLTIILLVVATTAVLASPPLDLHIVAEEYIATSGEPFAASGGAVLAGYVCASGTVDDLNVVVSGSGTGDFRILHVLKRFTCDDLTGTFDVEMVVKLNTLTGDTTARWKIVGGTISYVNLKGNGSLTGTPIIPGTSILDVYDGKAH